MSSEGHMISQGREGMLSIRGLPPLSHSPSGPSISPDPIYTFNPHSDFSSSRKSAPMNIPGPVLSDFLTPNPEIAALSHPSSWTVVFEGKGIGPSVCVLERLAKGNGEARGKPLSRGINRVSGWC